MGGDQVKRAVTSSPTADAATGLSEFVVCAEMQTAYDADPSEPPLWMLDPVRYRSPYARIVPTVLIRRRFG